MKRRDAAEDPVTRRDAAEDPVTVARGRVVDVGRGAGAERQGRNTVGRLCVRPRRPGVRDALHPVHGPHAAVPQLAVRLHQPLFA